MRSYVNEWIVKLEEVTDLARAIALAIEEKRRPLPAVPAEEEYVVEEALQRRLRIL